MRKILLNANLSPETAQFLRNRFGFEVVCLLTDAGAGLSDLAIAERAVRNAEIIITSDLDFGQLYHEQFRGELGIIVLRLEDQTVENVNGVLERFFSQEPEGIRLESSLIVIEENRIRAYGTESEGG